MRWALRTIGEGLPGSVPSVLEASQEGTGRVHDNRADPGGGSNVRQALEALVHWEL